VCSAHERRVHRALNDRLIVALIGVVDDANALLTHGVADAIDAGNQYEAGNLSPWCAATLVLRLAQHSRLYRTISDIMLLIRRSAMFFHIPEDARWNDDHAAVEFSVIIDPYEGTGPDRVVSSSTYLIRARRRAVHGDVPLQRTRSR